MYDTKIKRFINQIFSNMDTPLSVPEIMEALKMLKISVNKTTIYRELVSLLDQNKIIELDFGEGKKRYELNKDNHHHHLVCQSCQKIEHINVEDFEKTLNKVEEKLIRKNNFKVNSHSLDFFGVCRSCQ